MERWLVSKCLLGEKCRYDGETKASAAVMDYLKAKYAEVVPVCPECDCGMPCPRPPMIVVDSPNGLRLVDANGTEHTQQMTEWIDRRLGELELTPVDGAILKPRSHSCGFGTLQINGREHPDNGLFSDALHRRFPNLPILSEHDIPGAFTPLSPEKLIEKVTECVQRLLTNSPACHDWDHTLRVTNNACALMERTAETSFDPLVVKVAALMHDIGRPRELADCGKTNHAVYGAELAKEWLRAIGVEDAAFIDAVADCIRSHRFRKRDGGAQPVTFEQKLVYDADKLDSIGAIGIGRSFHFAGRTGARVHNRDAEALSGESYGREDTAYREYLVKLRHVMDAMLTPAGRELALHRHQFMVEFFDELNRECFGTT